MKPLNPIKQSNPLYGSDLNCITFLKVGHIILFGSPASLSGRLAFFKEFISPKSLNYKTSLDFKTLVR